MALLAAGVSVGRFFVINALSPQYLTSDLAGTVYDSLVPLVYASALSVGLAAVTVAIVAYLAGPFRSAIAVLALVAVLLIELLQRTPDKVLPLVAPDAEPTETAATPADLTEIAELSPAVPTQRPD